jgi:hypothetical protein
MVMAVRAPGMYRQTTMISPPRWSRIRPAHAKALRLRDPWRTSSASRPPAVRPSR